MHPLFITTRTTVQRQPDQQLHPAVHRPEGLKALPVLTHQLRNREIEERGLEASGIGGIHARHPLLQEVKLGRTAGPKMALDLNDPELEFSDLVYAYQSWVMAVINDEKLGGEETLLTDDIAEDALNSMRFLPGEVTSAIETSLARVYDVDADELAELLFPEE